MFQKARKMIRFMKKIVYKIPLGGAKPLEAHSLIVYQRRRKNPGKMLINLNNAPHVSGTFHQNITQSHIL